MSGATKEAPPGVTHQLVASPDTCFWGYLDREQPAVLTVEPGDEVCIEAVTHHSGDAPDLLMDEGIQGIWDAIPEARRGPGVHIMTGPIEVRGAAPGDTLRVELLEMEPRVPYGSNCAANWGLFYEARGKERITIYELVDPPDEGFPSSARPMFGFDFAAGALYEPPGVISEPDLAAREPFSRDVEVAVRPHLGVIGVAPNEPGRHSSIPPGVFGGNVDNWRFGPGALLYYPVFVEGAGFYVGDPHFAQGDGEICGTAIEASMKVRLRLSIADDVSVTAPLLRAPDRWFTHGFGDDLDEAMTMAADQMLRFIVDRVGCTVDEAYSLASVAVDVGVTQVVDGKLGCHAGVSIDLVGA